MTRVLLETITHLAERGQDEDSQDKAGAALKDFGHQLLPALVERGNVYAYPLNGYWRDVGTIGSYWLAHQELLAEPASIKLDAPEWPILTPGVQMLPARIAGTARIDNALVAPGSSIGGSLERAVIGPGVVVEAGAVVRDAIIFGHSIIRAGAVVERAIVDSGVVVGANARVGAPGTTCEEGDALNNEIAVVGAGAQIAAGISILPGDQVKPVERS